MDLSDSDVIGRVRRGDVDAYAVLVRRYYQSSLRYALRMLGNRADAEEATQDAFVRAYRSLDRYDDRDRFAAWLSRILVNRCRTLLTRQRRRDGVLVPCHAEVASVDAPDHPASEWSAEVQYALMQLRPVLREALLLRCVEGQSYEEIAAATGAGVSAVKMRVKRARDQLRELLQETYNA